MQVRELLNFDQREPFADALGLTVAMIGYYERGDREPDANAISRYQTVFNINANWLLTGDGSMFTDPSKAPAPTNQVDPLLMEMIFKAVDKAYRDAKHPVPTHRIAYKAAIVFNLLVSQVADVRNTKIVNAVVPVLVKELVDKLLQAGDEPGTGKRSAF